jgi:hypothetical protein
MGLFGVVGALVILLSRMGWGFGNLYVWGGLTLRGTLDLTQGLILRSIFGRIFGVERALSKTCFLVCLALPISGRHPLQIIWSVPTVLFNGALCFLA